MPNSSSATAPKTIKLIVTGDDLGLTGDFNAGILEAWRSGRITSTNIRVNGSAYREAIEETLPQMPGIGLGLHLNLVEGMTLRQPPFIDSTLTDSTGRFNVPFAKMLKMRHDRAFLKEVEAEFRNQLDIVMADSLPIDHLNTHQHSHVIPEVFEIVCRLAVEYGIPAIRLLREPFHLATPIGQHLQPWYLENVLKHLVIRWTARTNERIAKKHGLSYNDYFIGALYSGHMTPQVLEAGLKGAVRGDADVVEMLYHPVVVKPCSDEVYIQADVRDYAFANERGHERAAFLNGDFPKEVLKAPIKLVNFRLWDTTEQTSVIGIEANLSDEKDVKDSKPPLRVVVVLEETPLFHPLFLYRIAVEIAEANVVGVAIVPQKMSSGLLGYIVKQIQNLGVRDFFLLGLRHMALRALDYLPKGVRHPHAGTVRQTADDLGIKRHILQNRSKAELAEFLQDRAPDVIVSSNSIIFTEELLQIPKIAAFNRHSSLLPRNGGILPVFQAIKNDEGEVGTTLHMMDLGIDTGPVVARRRVPVFKDDTLFHLYSLCFSASVDATREAIIAAQNGTLVNTIANAKAEAEKFSFDHSYHSYPTQDDWNEFKRKGHRFI